jgi:hypothetical protein
VPPEVEAWCKVEYVVKQGKAADGILEVAKERNVDLIKSIESLSVPQPTEAAHVPVIWATQVLEPLAKTGISSRSEITDAAMGERAERVGENGIQI